MRIQSDKTDHDSVVSRSKEWGNLSQSLQYCLEKVPSADSHILDIGCNTGSLVYNLHLRGFKHAYGIDIEENKIEKGKLIYPELVDKLEIFGGKTLPYDNNSFDVVTMFDVIEHIDKIEQYLFGEVRRVLKKDGKFIFQTPNKYINIPWEILIHKSLTRYKSYHVSLQSYRSLNLLLKNSGFTDIRIEKRQLTSAYYLNELRKYLGIFAYPILLLFSNLPIYCTANFWGFCRRK